MADGPNLNWLIYPTSGELFAKSYWTKSPLVIKGREISYYDTLFSEEDIEATLQVAFQVPGSVEALDSQQLPRKCRSEKAAREIFGAGESIRIAAVHRFSRKLSLFSRILGQELHCPVNINIYLSPPGGNPALGTHYDAHDVFVLQLSGQKRWRLFDSAVPFPLEYVPLLQCEHHDRNSQRIRRKKDLKSQEAGRLTHEFILERGGLLYLPRGCWHEAKAEHGMVSCHLTVGPQSFTFLDLLMIGIGQAATANVNLRKPLPFAFGTSSEGRSSIREEFLTILQALPHSIDSESALSEIEEIFVRTRQHSNSFFLSSVNNINTNEIGLDSRVAVQDGLSYSIRLEQCEISLMLTTKVITLPRAFEAAYRFMIAAHYFVVRDLPGEITDPERVSFVQLLVANGFLAISTKQQASAQAHNELKGCLPIKLCFRGNTPQIEWLQFNDRKLSEPFFRQTVSSVKMGSPFPTIKTLGIEPLLHFQEGVPLIGFIFHASRCGSTLLANALRVVPGTIVISEAQSIGLLLAPRVATSRMSSEDWECLRDDLLKGIIRAFAQRRSTLDKGIVIKFSSWNIVSLNLVRRIFPEVPCVVMIREPLEILASCLRSPPGWLRLKQQPLAASHIFGWSEDSIREMSDERFCARAIGKFFALGAENVGSTCRVLSYDHLKSRIVDVAGFFGIDAVQFDFGRLDETLATYSKDCSRTRLFVDNQRAKRSDLTHVMRSECEQWCADAYRVVKGYERW